MGVRIQELPETTGINKEDVLIVEDGQGTKKGTVISAFMNMLF